MLVLSRRIDESIMIGDTVEITIVDVREVKEESTESHKVYKVRLGITSPKDVPVHRREIYDAIQREKAQKDAEPPKTPEGVGVNTYFKCGGAYESKELVQDAYIEVFPDEKRVRCTSRDRQGFCSLGHAAVSKCPFGVEKLV